MVKKANQAPQVQKRYGGKLGGIERGIDGRKLGEELLFFIVATLVTPILYMMLTILFSDTTAPSEPTSASMFSTGYHIAAFVVLGVMEIGCIYGLVRTVIKMSRL